MSLLHSMYAWGKLGCILLTTPALFLSARWDAIFLFCAVLPLGNALFFLRVPLVRKTSPREILSARELFSSAAFLLSFGAILFSGAAEATISQWSSTFMQDGLGLPKLWGDLAGAGGFSLMLGLGRLLHGLCGGRKDLVKLLTWGSLGAAVCCLLIGTVPLPWAGAAACALTGFFISIAWPGTLSIAAQRLPRAGTARCQKNRPRRSRKAPAEKGASGRCAQGRRHRHPASHRGTRKKRLPAAMQENGLRKHIDGPAPALHAKASAEAAQTAAPAKRSSVRAARHGRLGAGKRVSENSRLRTPAQTGFWQRAAKSAAAKKDPESCDSGSFLSAGASGFGRTLFSFILGGRRVGKLQGDT